MSEIHVLPKDISELIAAGEVIERPASVLKELTENAVDAGATHITAELKRGGVLYLRVTDDGCGIPPEEVRTAFLRHATSKIYDKSDLESILTLGFRGEALASVCAVSRTELLTRQKGSAYGTHYVIEGGEELSLEQSGCPEGTTIVVRDLFYNVPVRAGFLKKDTAEGNAAATVFQKIALSHPEISFRLIRENKTEFVTPGDGQLFSAIYAIFGKQFANDLIPVHYADENGSGIMVDGFVIKPLYARANRSMQLFFVNGRGVRSMTCSAALEEAYKTLIMTGKYPACVLQMQISPRIVDVNMHPTKAEVRFSDEKRVYSAIYFTAMTALTSNHLIYDFQFTKSNQQAETTQVQEKQSSQQISEQPKREVLTYIPKKPKTDWFAPVAGQDSNTPELLFKAEKTPLSQDTFPHFPPQLSTGNADSTKNCGKLVGKVEKSEDTAVSNVQKSTVENVDFTPSDAINLDVPPMSAITAFPDLMAQPQNIEQPEKHEDAGVSALVDTPIHVIGELFKNFILAEADDQLVMIDKHAAHERILFERFTKRQCKDRQNLLTPVVMLLTADEANALKEQSVELEKVGFTFDFEENPIVKLTGVPLSCVELELEQIIQEMAEQCKMQSVQPDQHLLDDYFHTLACKAAVRAGDHSDLAELQALAEQVWQMDGVRHCPHGRPVVLLVSKYKIEKQFRRIV